ncbi:MAG: FAD:protein FMN transferase [Oscillospiraceae bacterium]|jgi:thiamine biosynthesis lipoprotein|nr:FAD:protein FMN transferase [Oscillospiraceae bacterium]
MFLFLPACANRGSENNPVFRTQDGLLGTVINVSVYENVKEQVLTDMVARVRDIDAMMASRSALSDLSALNNSSGEAFTPPRALYDVIAAGLDWSARSNGAFDITIGPLVTLWDIGGTPKVPDQDRVDAAKALVDYKKVEMDPQGPSVRLQPGTRIDLGGIAKGYACDEAAAMLRDAGVGHAILDFGGNIYTIGAKPSGALWKIAIKTPVIGEQGYIGLLQVSDAAVVTSGPYERYFEQDGALFHHILDPDTGYPAQSGLLSVTIVCDSAMQADALSTACFVMGAEKGLGFLSGIEGAEAVFVLDDFSVRVTKGLTGCFQLLDERFDLYEADFT